MQERDIRLRFANLRKHDPIGPTAVYPEEHPYWVYVDRDYWRGLTMEQRIDYATFLLTPLIYEQEIPNARQLELPLTVEKTLCYDENGQARPFPLQRKHQCDD